MGTILFPVSVPSTSAEQNPGDQRVQTAKEALETTTNRLMKKRSRSNRKERRRNEEMNQAYIRLQQCVPFIRNHQKLSKIKILRIALRYIKHLQDILKGEMTRSSSTLETRPLEVEDFASVAMDVLETKNNYKDRMEQEVMHGSPVEEICRQAAPERYESEAQLNGFTYVPVPVAMFQNTAPMMSSLSRPPCCTGHVCGTFKSEMGCDI